MIVAGLARLSPPRRLGRPCRHAGHPAAPPCDPMQLPPARHPPTPSTALPHYTPYSTPRPPTLPAYPKRMSCSLAAHPPDEHVLHEERVVGAGAHHADLVARGRVPARIACTGREGRAGGLGAAGTRRRRRWGAQQCAPCHPLCTHVGGCSGFPTLICARKACLARFLLYPLCYTPNPRPPTAKHVAAAQHGARQYPNARNTRNA